MAFRVHPTTVKDANRSPKIVTSNLQVMTRFSRMNSGKLAATVLMQNAKVVPSGKPFAIKLSMTGITPVAFE
jgi:hypothetical protein